MLLKDAKMQKKHTSTLARYLLHLFTLLSVAHVVGKMF